MQQNISEDIKIQINNLESQAPCSLLYQQQPGLVTIFLNNKARKIN